MMDLIGLPLTSMILFILAGLLIGHALWYRDRSADFEKIHWLENRYLQARTVARLRRQQQHHLRKQRDDQQYEVGTTRQRLESNTVRMKALERKSEAATEELERIRAELHEATEQIRQEQRRNEMLVSQLQEVLKGKSNLDQQGEQQTSTTDDTLSQQALKLVNVREQLEELLPLRAESAESKLTIAEQRLELSAQQEEIERLRDQGSGTASDRRAA